jgi:riboflavin biosynthesis pyrimidine reductase
VPAIAVVTRSLDLGPATALLDSATPDEPVVIITTEDAPAERRTAAGKHARVIVAGERQVDVRAAISALAGLGYRAILAEGGPSLLGQVAGAALLDELCLTLSPVLVAGQADRMVSGAAAAAEPARLTLQHVLADDEGYLFCRYIRAART